jgi:outer membrane lipoprotein-sorting protein
MKSIKYLLPTLTLLCGSSLTYATSTKGKKTAPAVAAAARPSVAEKALTMPEIEELQKKLQSGKELTVEFTQTIYRSMRKKTSQRKGKGYFSKPDMFHWALHAPANEEWIYNGKFLAHHLPAKKSVYKYSPAAAKGKDLQILIDMVLNFSTLFNQYQLQSADQKGSIVRMQLKPKNDGEIVLTEITLDTDKNFISEIKLNMRGGNYTLFQFAKPAMGHIDAKLFNLPAGVKVEEVI